MLRGCKQVENPNRCQNGTRTKKDKIMITIDQKNKALVEFVRKQADKKNPWLEVWQSEETITINAGMARVTFLAPRLEHDDNFERVTVTAETLQALPVVLQDMSNGVARVTYPGGLVMHQTNAVAVQANSPGGVMGALTLPPAFLAALGNVAPAASTAHNRYILQGVNVRDVADGPAVADVSVGIRLAACDGRMLRVAQVPVDRVPAIAPNLTIPSAAVAQLLQLPAKIKKDCLIQMTWGEMHVSFLIQSPAGSIEIDSHILEMGKGDACRGSFPNYNVVTPTPGDVPVTVVVDAGRLAEAVRAMKPAWRTTQTSHSITLRVAPGKITLVGTGEASLAVDAPGCTAELAIAFDPKLLLILLDTYEGAVTLRFNDELAPCLMGTLDDYAVLMPMRLA